MVLIAVVRLVLSVPRYGRTAVPLGTQARFSRGVVQLYENKRHRMVVSNPSARFAYFLAIRNKQSALGNLKRPSSVSCSRTYALNLVWIRVGRTPSLPEEPLFPAVAAVLNLVLVDY